MGSDDFLGEVLLRLGELGSRSGVPFCVELDWLDSKEQPCEVTGSIEVEITITHPQQTRSR